MKKLLIFVMMITIGIMTSQSVVAEGIIAEINTNKSVIEGRFALEWDITPNFLAVGGSVIFNEDDFSIYGIDISYGALWLEQLKISMGFKGIMGTYDHFPEDADLGAVGFFITANYDFVSDYGFPFDIGITARACVAPEPLTFNDTEEYNEFEATLNFHILQQKAGSVLIGYRYIGMSFDKLLNISDETNSAAFIGYRLKF